MLSFSFRRMVHIQNIESDYLKFVAAAVETFS